MTHPEILRQLAEQHHHEMLRSAQSRRLAHAAGRARRAPEGNPLQRLWRRMRPTARAVLTAAAATPVADTTAVR